MVAAAAPVSATPQAVNDRISDSRTSNLAGMFASLASRAFTLS